MSGTAMASGGSGRRILRAGATAALLLLGACGGIIDPGGDLLPLDHLELRVESGADTDIAVNEPVQLFAEGKTASGGSKALGAVEWSSSDAAKAAVDATGRVTGKGKGTAKITAKSEGKEASIEVHVAGALHGGTIAANETWREADNPHYVKSDVWVGGEGSPVLTIEAGVQVRFSRDTRLGVGSGEAGGLKVQGTAEKPVHFGADAATPAPGHYMGLLLDDETVGGTSIEHLTIEHAGKSAALGHDGAFYLQGATVKPPVKHLTVKNSASTGVVLQNHGSFGPGSEALVVQGSGSSAVFVYDADSVGSLPAGSTLTGNAKDAILVEGGTVERSQTWKALGVPYVIHTEVSVNGAGTPVLTIEAGNTVRFSSDARLTVGWGEGGVLKVPGTEQKPVLFTADADEPGKGHWKGLYFFEEATGASVLSYATVEYAGRASGSGWIDANIVVAGDKGPFVTHSTIRHSASCGISRNALNPQPFLTDFTLPALANSFADNADGSQCGPE